MHFERQDRNVWAMTVGRSLRFFFFFFFSYVFIEPKCVIVRGKHGQVWNLEHSLLQPGRRAELV